MLVERFGSGSRPPPGARRGQIQKSAAEWLPAEENNREELLLARQVRVCASGTVGIELLKEFFSADYLAMQCPRNESVLLGLAAIRIGDRYVIGLERTAERPFEVGLGLREIGKGAKFGATGGDQVALGKNHLVDGGCAEIILRHF